MNSLQILTGRDVIRASLLKTFERHHEIKFEIAVFGGKYIIAKKTDDCSEITITDYQGSTDVREYEKLAADIFALENQIVSLRFQVTIIIIEFKEKSPEKSIVTALAKGIQIIVTQWHLEKTP